MVHDRRVRREARPPGAIEQAGTLRQLAGARSLSPFIRKGDSGQTDRCLPSLTGLGGKDYGVDLPVAAYVTVPRSLARRAMICSPPIPRTIETLTRGIPLGEALAEPRERPHRIRAQLRSGDLAFRSTKPLVAPLSPECVPRALRSVSRGSEVSPRSREPDQIGRPRTEPSGTRGRRDPAVRSGPCPGGRLLFQWRFLSDCKPKSHGFQQGR